MKLLENGFGRAFAPLSIAHGFDVRSGLFGHSFICRSRAICWCCDLKYIKTYIIKEYYFYKTPVFGVGEPQADGIGEKQEKNARRGKKIPAPPGGAGAFSVQARRGG
ncbi:hypothetical protein LWX53_03035 [bacterium]|nr:hypothetical protein [bacterium]